MSRETPVAAEWEEAGIRSERLLQTPLNTGQKPEKNSKRKCGEEEESKPKRKRSLIETISNGYPNGKRSVESATKLLKTTAEKHTLELVLRLTTHQFYHQIQLLTMLREARVFVLNEEKRSNLFLGIVLKHFSTRSSPHTVGFDCEFSKDKVAIVQLAFSAEFAVILQISEITKKGGNFPSVLKEILECDGFQKAGVNAVGDMVMLKRQFGVEAVNVISLERIASNYGYKAQSLVSLYYMFVDNCVPFKSVCGDSSNCDWETLVLADSAIIYAANDALAALLVSRAINGKPLVAVCVWDVGKGFTTSGFSPLHQKLSAKWQKAHPKCPLYLRLDTVVPATLDVLLKSEVIGGYRAGQRVDCFKILAKMIGVLRSMAAGFNEGSDKNRREMAFLTLVAWIQGGVLVDLDLAKSKPYCFIPMKIS